MSCIHRLNDFGLVSETSSLSHDCPSSRDSENPYFISTIWATSVKSSSNRTGGFFDGDDGLCKYRKDFFGHLRPRALVVGTLRVAVQQGSLIMANFMSDQLESEMKRNKLVQDGKLSQGEADEDAQEWEKVEWEKRWKPFPNRFFAAFTKYHFITILMRSYEYLAAQRYDRVILDKLTMDPFHASKAISQSKGSDNAAITKDMFRTTFWAYFISYLADYSVHQFILCFGYYTYVRRKRASAPEGGKNIVLQDVAIWTSMFRKSTQLLVNRAFGLACSSMGAALGTLWWPGWGAIFMSNMGEGAASMIFDDGQSSSKTKSTEDSS